MKKFITALIFTLLFSVLINARISNIESTASMPESRCTVPKTATTDREFHCLKGNVHTVKSEFAVFVKKDGQLVKSGVSQEQILTFDRQGNLIERLSQGTKDYGTESQIHRIVYNFDSQGIATGWEEYNSARPIPVKDVYTYDNKGRRIRQTVTYLESDVQSILIFIYDSEGNKVEERSYYPVPITNDSKKTQKIDEKYLYGFSRYKYAGKNIIQTTNYNKEGSITYKGIATYENGNQKEIIAYLADAKGNLIRSKKVSFEYDEKENIIEKFILNNDNSIINKYVDGFDELGYRISRTIYDSNGNITNRNSLTYEYDSQGNWLSYTSDDTRFSERRNSGEPFAGELRTIMYY